MPSALLFLVLVAHAGEADGGSAAPRRWTHPRGPASRSCMSHARAPESLGEPAWTYKAKAPVRHVPLTWDGIVYVREGERLVALDAESGRILASTDLPGAGAAAVDADAYYVRMGPRLVQWRRRDKGFTRRWSAVVGDDASAPCVHDGELYLTAGGQLVRLRPGLEKPAWKAGTDAYGAPALYGEEVYALEGGAVVARARLDGREVARLDLGAAGKQGFVAVNRNHVCARVDDRWVIARREAADGKVTISRAWTVPYREEPLLYPASTIGLAEKERPVPAPPPLGKDEFVKEMKRRKEIRDGKAEAPKPQVKLYRTYMLFRWLENEHTTGKGAEKKTETRIDQQDVNMVDPDDHPELFGTTGLPVALDDWFCTGLWCVDLNANEIVWHLHERPDRPILKDGVSLRPVPVDDDRLLVVSKDGTRIVCLKPEVIGK